MKLYYAPGACSLSPHIVAREAGLDVALEKVDLRSHKTADGRDYYQVNPKGYVPALELDDGRRLTEGPAIVQYLADQAPASGLVPPAGTLERYLSPMLASAAMSLSSVSVVLNSLRLRKFRSTEAAGMPGVTAPRHP